VVDGKTYTVAAVEDDAFASCTALTSITTNNGMDLKKSGLYFTKDNIKQKLSDRDFDLQLAQIGLGGFKPNTYDKKLLTKFINCFDREITKIIHREH
jgi:uncharacterized protein YaiI (UPF0178 family)